MTVDDLIDQFAEKRTDNADMQAVLEYYRDGIVGRLEVIEEQEALDHIKEHEPELFKEWENQ